MATTVICWHCDTARADASLRCPGCNSDRVALDGASVLDAIRDMRGSLGAMEKTCQAAVDGIRERVSIEETEEV